MPPAKKQGGAAISNGHIPAYILRNLRCFLNMKIVCYCYMRGGSEPLRGAVVSLYDKRGLFEQHKTDLTGRCVFSSLPRANYVLRETYVPNYALKSRTVHKIKGADCRRYIEIGFASAPRFAYDENMLENPEVRGKINELRERLRTLYP